MDRARISRWELAFVVGVTIVGAIIRVTRIWECGLSHFDAGIYAESGLWPYTGGFHPYQGYYSPPLFPFLIGIANLLLGGPTDYSGVLVSVVAGTLLIPLGWWLGRAWFSPAAGVLAALAICLSGFQIVFARVGLTDALFTLLFVAGFAATRSAIFQGTWLQILGASALVGLAWNTKYNGFLPLILAAGYLKPDIKVAFRFASISIFSFLLYLPWAIEFHVKHGYGTLLDHQRGYIQGIDSIWENWLQALRWLEVAETPSAALVLITAASLSAMQRKWPNALILITFAVIASLFEISQWGVWIWIPAAFLGAATSATTVLRRGGLWVLALLIVLPAIYAPYLRLWLPSHVIILIFATGGIAWISSRKVRYYNSLRKYCLSLILGYILTAVGIWLGFRSDRFGFWMERGWSPQVGYRTAIRESLNCVTKNSVFVYSMCRWPANYYLHLNGIPVQPLAGEPFEIGCLEIGDRLLVDRAVLDTPSFESTMDVAERTLNLRSYSIEADLPTLLDDYHGNDLERDLPSELERYRLREYFRSR